MMRQWLGITALSVSWLWGLEFTHDVAWGPWAIGVLLGLALIRCERPLDVPARWAWGLALAGLLGLRVCPGAYGAGPAAWTLAWLLVALPLPESVRRRGRHLALGALILMVQALALELAFAVTARWPVVSPVWAEAAAWLGRALGFEVVAQGSVLAIHTMRQVFPLDLSWSLLVGPAAWAWIVGACVDGWVSRRSLGGALLWGILMWMPLQVLLQGAWLLQRALRTAYDEPVTVMAPFWNRGVGTVAVLGLAGVTVWWARRSRQRSREDRPAAAPRLGLLWGLGLAVAAVTVGVLWDPPGLRKAGNVWVDEHHSTWERTDRPFDTTWYGHDSGYNYACIYDYLNRFYDMNRVMDGRLTPERLNGCDVLVVKTPTERYDPREIEAIERFVRDGGGLLLIGEHTNVFNTGTYLNDIAQVFGFRFSDDCLFDIDTPFEQDYRPPVAAHPVVQAIERMDFAVSCSIETDGAPGRAAIRSLGLRRLPADYHVSNFYPQVEDRAESRWGPMVQLWTRRFGEGRVVAFTDSTIFSNFATFEPGKPELMLGMVEWANRRNLVGRPHLWCLGLGLLGLAGLWRSRRQLGTWPVTVGVSLAAVSLGTTAVAALQRATVPLPAAERSMVRVVMDRTVCRTVLPKSGFIAGEADGFGIFERWILRLGYFTTRQAGSRAFEGDLLIFTYPSEWVSDTFRRQLVQYVENGGEVLVIDGPANAQSTANSLLVPFGLRLRTNPSLRNVTLTTPEGWPQSIQVQAAHEVEGGEPLIHSQTVPVAAQARYGQGRVTVIGFGGRFCDQRMGVTGDVEPDATLERVFQLEYRLIRSLIQTR